jgi:hypothetical protein
VPEFTKVLAGVQRGVGGSNVESLLRGVLQRCHLSKVQSVSRKIRRKYVHCSILRTSILRLFLGPLVVWPKVGENTELLRISKE